MMRSRHLPHIVRNKIAPLLDDSIDLESAAASRIQSIHRGRNVRNQYLKIRVGALATLLPTLRDDVILLKQQYSALQNQMNVMANEQSRSKTPLKPGKLLPLVRPLDNVASPPIVMLPMEMQGIEKVEQDKPEDIFMIDEEEHVTEEEIPEHGYNLSSSMWDVSILFGTEVVGEAGSIYGALLLLLNIGIQFVFAYIVATTFTAPTFSSSTIIGFRHWRRNVAHNSAFMDELSQVSLAARVCNNDAALELSSYQATSHQHLSAYLNQAGALMCALTVTMWLLTVAKEITVLSNFWRALSCIPSAKKTRLSPARNSFAAISDERRFAVRCVHVCRLAVVVCLGYAGTAWLVNTVSVTDLILNAVALEFVLCVDEIIFEALAPRGMVCTLDTFSQVVLPFPAPIEWKGLDIQSFSIFSTVLAGLLTIWFLMITPFVVNLGNADDALCAGRHDFVYTMGKTGTPVWSGSRPFSTIVFDADPKKAESAGSGVWKLDDTSLFEDEAKTMNFARKVIDSVVEGYGTEYIMSENSTNGCGENIRFNVYEQNRTFPVCGFEDGGLCVMAFCEARYFVGLILTSGEVLAEFTPAENACCVADQIKSPNIFGGRLSLNGFETETVSTSIEIWNPGCVDMLGELAFTSSINEVTVFSFMNLLAGAMGDALTGVCGLCPAARPFCDPQTNTCIAINCTYIKDYCFEDNTAGVRARQVCPQTCECWKPSSKLILSGPEYGCPSTCEDQDQYRNAVIDALYEDTESTSTEMMAYLDEVSRISAEWPSYWSEYWNLHAKIVFMNRGCDAVNDFQDASLPMNFCVFGGTVWPIKPVSYLCPVTCGCEATPELWGCPRGWDVTNDDGQDDQITVLSYSYSYFSFDTDMIYGPTSLPSSAPTSLPSSLPSELPTSTPT